jgi:hypothetical protein
LHWAGQNSPPVQRATASSSPRTTCDPHSGHTWPMALEQVDSAAVRPRAARQSAPTTSGNHVARTAHDHPVADPHILAIDLPLVVQGRVGHRHAADEHRLKTGHRRDRARASRPARRYPAGGLITSWAGYLWATAQRGSRVTKPRVALQTRGGPPCTPPHRCRKGRLTRARRGHLLHGKVA